MAKLERISANLEDILRLAREAQAYTRDAEFDRRERQYQTDKARERRANTVAAIQVLRDALNGELEREHPGSRDAVKDALGCVAIGQQVITREQIVEGLNALQRVRHGSLWPEADPYADWFQEADRG